LNASGSRDEADGSALRRFEALFHEHADAVLAYAMRRSDADTAEEIVSETFAVAWRRRDVVPDPPLPWLLGVARRILANERRSRSRADALALRLVRESAGSSDDPAEVVEARLSMQAALGGLLPAEREVLQLLAWEGLSAAQAAEALGCSRVAITLRMHRARRRFHRLLAEPPEQTLLTNHQVRQRHIDHITRVSRMKEADDAR
jgi:RNA polymerase sigma-70 factor, ECF subfamily